MNEKPSGRFRETASVHRSGRSTVTAPSSQIFTLEVDGTPTLVFEATDHDEALQICADADFRSDLATLTSGGIPIWSGNTTFCPGSPSSGDRRLRTSGQSGTDFKRTSHGLSRQDRWCCGRGDRLPVVWRTRVGSSGTRAKFSHHPIQYRVSRRSQIERVSMLLSERTIASIFRG